MPPTKKSLPRSPVRYGVPEMVGKYRLKGMSLWIPTQVTDLSFGGACITTKDHISKDSEVELMVDTVDPKRLKRQRLMKGRVAWSRGGKTGLQFLTKERKGS